MTLVKGQLVNCNVFDIKTHAYLGVCFFCSKKRCCGHAEQHAGELLEGTIYQLTEKVA